MIDKKILVNYLKKYTGFTDSNRTGQEIFPAHSYDYIRKKTGRR